jgi:putative phosphoesterase
MPGAPKRDAGLTVGVLSDTHGLLRPEAAVALQGSDHIIHLGDVGDSAILGTLSSLAPVTAIRGNIDLTGPCAQLPAARFLTLGGHKLYLLHNFAELRVDPTASGLAAVLYGHTHKPRIENRNGVVFFNPGSCGPRRFALPVTLGRLRVTSKGVSAEIIELV